MLECTPKHCTETLLTDTDQPVGVLCTGRIDDNRGITDTQCVVLTMPVLCTRISGGRRVFYGIYIHDSHIR